MSYPPDSSAKSYTLATPISLPFSEYELNPTLESLRLIVEDVLIPIEGAPDTLFTFRVDPKLKLID